MRNNTAQLPGAARCDSAVLRDCEWQHQLTGWQSLVEAQRDDSGFLETRSIEAIKHITVTIVLPVTNQDKVDHIVTASPCQMDTTGSATFQFLQSL